MKETSPRWVTGHVVSSHVTSRHVNFVHHAAPVHLLSFRTRTGIEVHTYGVNATGGSWHRPYAFCVFFSLPYCYLENPAGVLYCMSHRSGGLDLILRYIYIVMFQERNNLFLRVTQHTTKRRECNNLSYPQPAKSFTGSRMNVVNAMHGVGLATAQENTPGSWCIVVLCTRTQQASCATAHVAN